MRRSPRGIQRLAHLPLAVLDPEPIVHQVSSRHLRVPYRRVHTDQFQNPVDRGDDLASNVILGVRQDVPVKRPIMLSISLLPVASLPVLSFPQLAYH